jgi:hypothetical protein
MVHDGMVRRRGRSDRTTQNADRLALFVIDSVPDGTDVTKVSMDADVAQW